MYYAKFAMEKDHSLSVYFVLLLSVILGICYTGNAFDPCFEAYHKNFPKDNIGSRNEKCSPAAAHHEACDHYLPDDWYHVTGSVILTRCPKKGNCGVLYPVWMNGTLPTVAEGIVSRTACVKNNNNCCKTRLQIEVKNCTGYFVYHLVPVATCPTAYCFVSDLPCVPLTTITTTETNAHYEEPWCDATCIKIIIPVCTLVLIVVLVIAVLVCKHEACCKKSRICSENEDVVQKVPPPPPYENIYTQK